MNKLQVGLAGLSASRRAFALCCSLLLLALQGCGKDEPAAGFGLELRKPAGWTYVSAGVSGAHGDDVRYDAATLAKAIATHTSAPLFALLKRAPPQRSLNPTFGINLDRSSGTAGQTALALLTTRVARATDKGPFELAQAATATKLAGLDAAHAELRTPAGKTVATRVRLDLLVVGDVTVLLAATDAPSGENEASAEFKQIIDSLRLPGETPTP